jgi:hypothetical protein
MLKKELALDIFTVMNHLSRSQAVALAERGHGEYIALLKRGKLELVEFHEKALKVAQSNGCCTCWADHCGLHGNLHRS